MHTLKNCLIVKIITASLVFGASGCGDFPLLKQLQKDPKQLLISNLPKEPKVDFKLKEDSFWPRNENAISVRKDGGVNLAVAPGGGLNAYTSLYLALKFSESVGKHFDEMFDLFFGLSGGSVAGTILMNKKYDDLLDSFKERAEVSFPDIQGVIRDALVDGVSMEEAMSDAKQRRIDAFEHAALTNLKDLTFNHNAGNKFVLVASAEERPVCYADSNIKLPKNCVFRVPDGTRVVEGIINSSNFQLRKDDMMKGMPKELQLWADMLPGTASLFYKRPAVLLPDNKEYEVIDGVFADKKYLDSGSPLPLALDYVLENYNGVKAEHNVVVFDNGSAINSHVNEEFRRTIGMNEAGFARIEKNNTIINVFLIKLSVDEKKFEEWMYVKDPNRWAAAEKLINEEIQGPRKEIFEGAISWIKDSLKK